jgi:hypothetical protein
MPTPGASIRAIPTTGLSALTKLRFDAGDARAKAAEDGWLAEIVGDLLIGIADEGNENLLAQKRLYVKMEIDAALVLRIAILEIVGEAADAGQLRACRLFQIGVAGAEVCVSALKTSQSF